MKTLGWLMVAGTWVGLMGAGTGCAVHERTVVRTPPPPERVVVTTPAPPPPVVQERVIVR